MHNSCKVSFLLAPVQQDPKALTDCRKTCIIRGDLLDQLSGSSNMSSEAGETTAAFEAADDFFLLSFLVFTPDADVSANMSSEFKLKKVV